MRIGMMVDMYKPHVSGITTYVALNKQVLEGLGHRVFVFTFGDEDYDDEPLEPQRAARPAPARSSARSTVRSVPSARGGDEWDEDASDEDAATQYFRKQMSSPLKQAMTPVVNEELAKAGAVKTYDQMMGQYRNLPVVPDAKANLTDHVLERAIDGIFLYLGREEAAIRENPARRTSEIVAFPSPRIMVLHRQHDRHAGMAAHDNGFRIIP